MKKENIVELNIGVYESIKLKINRIIAMDILTKFPQLSKVDVEGSKNIEESIGIGTLYEIAIYGLYKMANALNKEFTYEKAEEIFEYASNVLTIVDGEKQPCDMILVSKIMNEIQEVFTKEKGKEVQVVEFKME